MSTTPQTSKKVKRDRAGDKGPVVPSLKVVIIRNPSKTAPYVSCVEEDRLLTVELNNEGWRGMKATMKERKLRTHAAWFIDLLERDARGELNLRPQRALLPKTEARALELDAALNLSGEQGVAEEYVSSLISDLMKDETTARNGGSKGWSEDFIIEGRQELLKETTIPILRLLEEKWRAEDGLPPLTFTRVNLLEDFLHNACPLDSEENRKLCQQLAPVLHDIRLGVGEVVKIALRWVLSHYEQDGAIILPPRMPLSPITARRICQLDRKLDLDIANGSGYAEATMSSLLKGIIKGDDDGGIIDGWEFNERGTDWAKQQLRELGAQWKAEDDAEGEAAAA